MSKVWNNASIYSVKAKAKDVHGDESSWSDSLSVCINGLWEDDPSNPCQERRLTCSETYEYRNKPDGTDCGTDYYDDWVSYCKGDEVWKHRQFHDFYCEGGTCTDHTSWVDDQLVENCNDYDGWVDTANTRWIDDPANECQEEEQKEQEYQDYTCSVDSCTYNVTDTQWTDTGNTRNKSDGTDCGTDYYDDWVNYCQGDEVWKHRQFHDFYCEAGSCSDHTSWVDDQLVEDCNTQDGWADTGETKWVTTEEYECKLDQKEEKEQEYRDYTCSGASCVFSVTNTQWVDTGNTQTINKTDGTDCGTDYYDDWVNYCQGEEVWKHRLHHDFYCEGGTCTDHTSWVDDQLVENCNDYDGWVDTGETRWLDDPEDARRKIEQKEQEFRDYYCDSASCAYEVTDTRWVDTGAAVSSPDPDITITDQDVTDDPASDPDIYDPANMPGGVTLENAKGFYLEATGPDGENYEFFITFETPVETGFTLYKLPAWTEVPYTIVGPNTIRVELNIVSGVLDPAFVLAAGSTLTGVTGEVNCDILQGVTITLYEDGEEKGSTTSDGSGNYTLAASISETGDYEVVASKEGFKDETQTLDITELGQEYPLNFCGETGLIPNAPDMFYVLVCVNHWLYPEPPCDLTVFKVLKVVNAWLYPTA